MSVMKVAHSNWTDELYGFHRGKQAGFLVLSEAFVVVSLSFRR